MFMAGRYRNVEDSDKKVVSIPGLSDRELSDDEAKKKSDELMPDYLSDTQAKAWNERIPEFVKAGRAKKLYVDFFVEYIRVVLRMQELLSYCEENGWKYVTEGRNGEQHRPRPEAGQYNDDWRKWNSMCNQMGLSPATDQRFNDVQPDLFDHF